jgi:polyhydroxyalkanoate synthesis regulator protein
MEELFIKYKNRKFYRRNFGYVKLADIKQSLLEGKSVRVINHLNEDITEKTLKKVRNG